MNINKSQFDKYLNLRLNSIKSSLQNKSDEYSTENSMYNFVKAAEIDDNLPEEELHSMMMKHFVTYLKELKGLKDDKIPSIDKIRERFGDIINYFIMQEMMFLKRAKYE